MGHSAHMYKTELCANYYKNAAFKSVILSVVKKTRLKMTFEMTYISYVVEIVR